MNFVGGGNLQKLEMLAGERRRIYLEVSASDNAPFTIHNPSYEFCRYDDIVETGGCELEDHTLIVLVNPTASGLYRLKYTYEIAGELLKEIVEVRVV